ncbi:MAG: 3-oxoacyl-ACP reductase [Desulfobacterales bacterium]|nr:3-oxoacyl-ACP reductase [Desulfobacterales bacterium]
MSDFLLNLGKNSIARKAIKKMGLPVHLPQELKRPKKPWQDRPIQDFSVFTAQVRKTNLTQALAKSLAASGANTWLVGNKEIFQIYEEEGNAWGRLPKIINLDDLPKNIAPKALIFDGTGLNSPDELKAVYDFFHKTIRSISACSRIIIFSRTVSQIDNPVKAATAKALEGFVRSLGKEIGRNGSTAQLIYVDKGSEERVEPILRFCLSDNSAYISGQTIHVSNIAKRPLELPKIRPLEGKIALVTGGAMGIGAATAKVLAREGAHVICLDRSSENEPASKLVSDIKGTLCLCDITDKSAPSKIIELINSKFKGLDIIIHNAGITRDKTLAKMDSDRWEQTLNVNLISLIKLNEELLPVMRDDARIVCLSSVTGIAGNMGQTNYSASKAGIIGYVQNLASKIADKGITINAVAPGFIETKMTSKIPFFTREVARRLCNLGQGGLPEDVAETITFLASPGSYGITGEVLRVCGGSLIGA